MSDAVISIVSYCQRSLLDRCLTNIRNLSLPTAWKIIVVDNNSTDGSADMVAQNYPFVELVRLKKNLGFAGGHNVAFRKADSPIFFVINPDVIILPGSLETLVQMFGRFPNAGIVGPCLMNPDGSPQFSARRFYTWKTIACRRLPIPGSKKINDHHLMKDSDLNQVCSVDWMLGAALGIRKVAFPDNGLFDTRYKLYFEDVDLCYFAKKRGWDVLYCPQSKMIHDHQRASAKTFFSSTTVNHFASWIKFYLKSKVHIQISEPPVNRLPAISKSK